MAGEKLKTGGHGRREVRGVPHPRVFLQKSLELHENNGDAILAGAKEFAIA
jgi:hypothetical protein